MKLEKINENQIRCVLSKTDLLDREIRISELAYGSDKTKSLFKEMMQQAAYELGFEAENIPLVIEAIPVPHDSLMLIVTKVSDPDELDARFSKFSQTPEMLTINMDEEDEAVDDEPEDDNIEDMAQRQIENITEALTGPTMEMIESLCSTFSNALQGHISNEKSNNKESTGQVAEKPVANSDSKDNAVAYAKIFIFDSLTAVENLASSIGSSFKANNILYKDSVTGRYYLFVYSTELSSKEFNRLVHVASEHGERRRATLASKAYLDEHLEVIIKKDALKVLASI